MPNPVHKKYPTQVAQADAPLRIRFQNEMRLLEMPGGMPNPNTAKLNAELGQISVRLCDQLACLIKLTFFQLALALFE
jgi:hypothetical protein